MVGGESEWTGQTGEFRLPIGGLSVEHLTLQPPALPLGKVGILNRQLRQRRAPPTLNAA